MKYQLKTEHEQFVTEHIKIKHITKHEYTSIFKTEDDVIAT